MHSRNRFRYKYSNFFGNNSILFDLFEMLKKCQLKQGVKKCSLKKWHVKDFLMNLSVLVSIAVRGAEARS